MFAGSTVTAQNQKSSHNMTASDYSMSCDVTRATTSAQRIACNTRPGLDCTQAQAHIRAQRQWYHRHTHTHTQHWKRVKMQKQRAVMRNTNNNQYLASGIENIFSAARHRSSFRLLSAIRRHPSFARNDVYYSLFFSCCFRVHSDADEGNWASTVRSVMSMMMMMMMVAMVTNDKRYVIKRWPSVKYEIQMCRS